MDVLLNEIANSGPWGPLLALSIAGNIWLVLRLLAEKDKRITAAELTRDNIAAPLSLIQGSLDLIQQKVSISKERSNV